MPKAPDTVPCPRCCPIQNTSIKKRDNTTVYTCRLWKITAINCVDVAAWHREHCRPLDKIA